MYYLPCIVAKNKIIASVKNNAGKKLHSEMSFQIKIDGTWGPIHTIILQKIPPQTMTLQLTPKEETVILDEKIFEWEAQRTKSTKM